MLIVERDVPLRHVLVAILDRAGFLVRGVADDAAAAFGRQEYDVIVRDARPARATAGELRRTVIATRAAACGATAAGELGVFAVLAKPLDVESFVSTVSACARESRHEAQPCGTRSGELDPIARFVRGMPALRRALDASGASAHELMVSSELRRTASALAAMLDQAAHDEMIPSRSALYHSASTLAAELAGGSDASQASGRGH